MKKIPIKLIENHDEAYFFWKKLAVTGKPLIHLDAHIDFNFHAAKPIRQTFEEAKSKADLIKQVSTNLMYSELRVKEKQLTNIGNYIYPAMRDGIVTDFYWVIPGGRSEFYKSLRNLRNTAKSFFPLDPFETRKFKAKKGILKATIYKRNFFFTTLDDLPRNIKGALLDIDTDYLTTDTIRKAAASRDAGRRFPWIWPQELVKRLEDKKIEPSCVTVAYSVNGGFTPLVYKFLGDEVALFLEDKVSGKLKDIIFRKNGALTLFTKGKTQKSACELEVLLKEADSVNADAGLKKRLKAHLSFILFRCYARLGKRDEAKSRYDLAIENDKTCRARDNNYGPMYLRRKGYLRKAEEEFKTVLSADKNNSHALSGLGNILLRRRNTKKARAIFKKAYAVNNKNTEALFGLTRAELLSKNYRAALRYAERYNAVSTLQASAYSLKAASYEGLGKFEDAIEEYRLAHRFGMDLGLYTRLFRLLRKTGIPENHREWINSRIESFRTYRKNYLGSLKKRPRGKPDMKAVTRTKKILKRIDILIKDVK